MTADLETCLELTMRAVAESTSIPDLPETTASPQHHRFGRPVTTLIAAGCLGVVGVGTAAATGVLDPGAKQAFNGFTVRDSHGTHFSVDPHDASLLANLPGPAGTEIAAYESVTSMKGMTCVAEVILHNTARPNFGTGGACGNSPASSQGEFEGLGQTATNIVVAGYGKIATFVFPSGPATSAEVEYGGKAHPAAVGHGYVVGWVPASQWPTATLILRGGDGDIVGELDGIGGPDSKGIVAPNAR